MNRDRALDQVKAATFIGKNAAFLGCLLCGLNFHWSKEIPTAGVTTNNTFIWNPDFFDSLSFKERQFILLHELWHIALLHGVRCGDRDPKRWIAACDYRINANLIKDGYTDMPQGVYLMKIGWEMNGQKSLSMPHYLKIQVMLKVGEDRIFKLLEWNKFLWFKQL